MQLQMGIERRNGVHALKLHYYANRYLTYIEGFE